MRVIRGLCGVVAFWGIVALGLWKPDAFIAAGFGVLACLFTVLIFKVTSAYGEDDDY